MKETEEQKEFRLLYVELEEDDFELLLNDVEGYVNRFQTKRKKIAFLRYFQNAVYHESSGSIFIHPDELDYGNCYLSKFDDPSKIMWLFTYRIERIIWELNYGKKPKKNFFAFELQEKYKNENNVLEVLFTVLYDLDYIEDPVKDNFIKIFSANDIYQVDSEPIEFNMKVSLLAFLFDRFFRKLFTHVDESKIFSSKLFFRKGKPITTSSIQNARAKVLKNSREEDYYIEIDRIESNFLSVLG